jgi:hypothetical protein
MVRRVTTLLAFVLCCTVASCGGATDAGSPDSRSGGTVSVSRDESLEAALRQASSDGTTVRLAEVTDFSWTDVYVFSEGATPEEVREAVGVPVLDGRYYDAGNLLVFCTDGQVDRAVTVVPDMLRASAGTPYGPDTELVPLGSVRPAILELRQPAA